MKAYFLNLVLFSTIYFQILSANPRYVVSANDVEPPTLNVLNEANTIKHTTASITTGSKVGKESYDKIVNAGGTLFDADSHESSKSAILNDAANKKSSDLRGYIKGNLNSLIETFKGFINNGDDEKKSEKFVSTITTTTTVSDDLIDAKNLVEPNSQDTTSYNDLSSSTVKPIMEYIQPDGNKPTENGESNKKIDKIDKMEKIDENTTVMSSDKNVADNIANIPEIDTKIDDDTYLPSKQIPPEIKKDVNDKHNDKEPLPQIQPNDEPELKSTNDSSTNINEVGGNEKDSHNDDTPSPHIHQQDDNSNDLSHPIMDNESGGNEKPDNEFDNPIISGNADYIDGNNEDVVIYADVSLIPIGDPSKLVMVILIPLAFCVVSIMTVSFGVNNMRSRPHNNNRSFHKTYLGRKYEFLEPEDTLQV